MAIVPTTLPDITDELLRAISNKEPLPWPGNVIPAGHYQFSAILKTPNSFGGHLHGRSRCPGFLQSAFTKNDFTTLYYTGPPDQTPIQLNGAYFNLSDLGIVGQPDDDSVATERAKKCIQTVHSDGIGGAKHNIERVYFHGWDVAAAAGFSDEPAASHHDKMTFIDCAWDHCTYAFEINNSQSLGHVFIRPHFMGGTAIRWRSGGVVTIENALCGSRVRLISVEKWPQMTDGTWSLSKIENNKKYRPGKDMGVINVNILKVDANDISETETEKNFKLITSEYDDIPCRLNVNSLLMAERWSKLTDSYLASLSGPWRLAISNSQHLWPACFRFSTNSAGKTPKIIESLLDTNDYVNGGTPENIVQSLTG